MIKKYYCETDNLIINIKNQPDIEPDLGEKISKSWKPAKQDFKIMTFTDNWQVWWTQKNKQALILSRSQPRESPYNLRGNTNIVTEQTNTDRFAQFVTCKYATYLDS